MKILSLLFASLFVAGFLCAQDAAVEEKQIPTEVSEPPYLVGNLISDQGYTIEREGNEAGHINVRIVNNQFRVYFIDDDNLVLEPEFKEMTVRLVGASQASRNYYHLSALGDDTGLGSPLVIRPPHVFNAVLVVPSVDGGDLATYNFRYLSSMNQPKDSSESNESASASGTSSY